MPLGSEEAVLDFYQSPEQSNKYNMVYRTKQQQFNAIALALAFISIFAIDTT